MTRLYILALASGAVRGDHDWDGCFSTLEEAVCSLRRARYFRVRINELQVAYIGVLEGVDTEEVESLPTD